MPKTMKIFHVTTEKKAKLYRQTGYIKKPIRGFSTLLGACVWAMRVGRRVIYECDVTHTYPLPDHHNPYGIPLWTDENISVEKIKCLVSPKKAKGIQK